MEKIKIKKLYKATKVILKNELKLQSVLNHYFDSSDNYLDYNIENKKIVIDQRIPKNILSVSPKKKLQTTHYRQKDWYNKSNKSIFLDIFSTSKNSSRAQFKSSKNKLKEIDKSELNEIYSLFKKKKIENSKSNVDLFKGYDGLIRNHMNTLLNSQFQTLKDYSKEKEHDDVMSDTISRKILKAKEKLLMNSMSYYRSRQEIKNEIDRDLKKREALFPRKWPGTLRNRCDNDFAFFMNTSTADRPRWHCSVVKMEDKFEKIYSPKNSNSNNNKNQKLLNALITNTYLNKRITSPTIKSIKRNIINEEGVNEMVVEGRDLLQLEHDMAKQFKGKILIAENNNKIAEQIEPVLFYKSLINPLVNLGKKSITKVID